MSTDALSLGQLGFIKGGPGGEDSWMSCDPLGEDVAKAIFPTSPPSHRKRSASSGAALPSAAFGGLWSVTGENRSRVIN